MTHRTIIILIAILAVTGLELAAMHQDINGKALAAAIGIIGALGGSVARELMHR